MIKESAYALRSMTAEDLAEVLAIEKESFPQAWARSAFESALRRREAVAMVCTSDAQVIGYFVLEMKIGEGHLTNLAVHPDHRRRRVASRCLDAVVEAARKRGATRVSLEVEESNLPAHLLYRKAGFRAIAVLRNHYAQRGEDGYRMERKLEAPATAGRG